MAINAQISGCDTMTMHSDASLVGPLIAINNAIMIIGHENGWICELQEF